MSILKIRDENGNVHPIAIMKGDKGDGVPEGGTTGQVIKKTADGTEWGDTGVPDNGIAGQVLKKTESGTEWGDVVTCEILLQNNDINLDTFTIEKRGLYEVTMFYSQANLAGFLDPASYVHEEKFLISVSDLDKQQWIASLALLYMDNGVPKYRKAGILYKNKTFTATYAHVVVSGSTVEERTNKRAYIAEVRLIIPYD